MTDTPAKRATALGAGLTPGVLLPTPDGSIDEVDRALLAGAYPIGDLDESLVIEPPASRTIRVRKEPRR